jgi:hypothetical protein
MQSTMTLDDALKQSKGIQELGHDESLSISGGHDEDDALDKFWEGFGSVAGEIAEAGAEFADGVQDGYNAAMNS